ncbi:EGF-like calcium-binding domain-containing protein [Artemisia annua]|uniref:EGF-like calcium-binding domain-containing protein n=1 Tax=Artemisia annua TaxID=35608 RepID=A0A2U1MD89_ARTAN|nr:EGF-like calcium-binding domain-containing protein [Artemisia annua]
MYPCHGVCVNTPGSYDCMCRRGYNGNAKIQNGCKRSVGYSKLTTIIFILAGVVLGIGILVLSIGFFSEPIGGFLYFDRWSFYYFNINECDGKSSISCYGNCINTEGSYNCTCWPGYTGNAKTLDGCQPVAKGSQFPVMIFTLVLATLTNAGQLDEARKVFGQMGWVM